MVKGQPDSSRRKDWKLVRRQTRPVVYPEVKDTCLKILANSLHSIKINCHYTSHYLLFTVQYTPIDYRSLPSAALKYGLISTDSPALTNFSLAPIVMLIGPTPRAFRHILFSCSSAIHHPEATDLELQASSHSSNLTELLDATPGLYLAILVPSFSVWHCMGWTAGYIAAIRGIIDCKCRRQLNRLNVGLFTPALVFGKVAFFLTPEKLAGLWIIPASFAIITSVSFASAWCLGKMFRLSRLHLNVAVAGAMFMNTNTIPIALIQSLSLSLDKLKINNMDTPDKELGRAFSYLAVYSLLGSLLRWSYGVRLLQNSDPAADEKEKFRKALHAGVDCEKYNFPSSETTDTRVNLNDAPMPDFIDLAVPTRAQGAYRISGATACSYDSDIFTAFPKSNVRFSYPTAFGAYSNLIGANGTGKGSMRISSATVFSDDSEVTQYDIDGDPRRKSYRHGQMTIPEMQSCNDVAIVYDELPRLQPIWENQIDEAGEGDSQAAPGQTTAPLPGEERTAHNRKKMPPIKATHVLSGAMRFIRAVEKFANPPLISSVLSIVVACIPPLQHWLSGIQILRNSSSQQAGRKSVKASHSAMEFEHSSHKSPRNQTTTIILALLSRHLITPLILLPLMYILSKFARVPILADPIFLLTTVLLIGAPPAITLSQMATKQDGHLEKLVSRLLFWSFIFITPLTTLLLVGIAIMIHDTRQG
ncbi:hypothetical protein PSTT_02669 [Puccinia striiformis]|uniref:Uncharacterized protein n=1 Tax=Puccinia striiformis TaxID=27350 RepID=A0A2S4VZ91_9BASI|nr:hypothetical protein PSTT_02669 [Puccinia striiformis]